ncbi:MAG: Hsp20/alpha crystallin family protein [Patescibacteria group bacterium]|mgnify:CR=1 FL=1
MEEDNVFVELAKAKAKSDALSVSEEASMFESDSDGRLTVDVFQDGDDVVVQSAVAGVHEKDVDVHIAGDSVTIRGKRNKSNEIKEKDYYYQECFWGQFSRTVILPEEVDPEKSTATIKNGILTIRMPKIEKQKTKKLKVKQD